ncbi:hypothetical protein ACFL38_01625 [Candidatus Omnitrophota bacterium]
MILITVFALLFVQLQVAIVSLAYACQEKEHVVNKMLDDQHVLLYNIHTLESAGNVGQFLVYQKPELQFAAKEQLAELRLPIRSNESFALSGQQSKGQRQNFVARMFSLKSQAEATEKLNK